MIDKRLQYYVDKIENLKEEKEKILTELSKDNKIPIILKNNITMFYKKEFRINEKMVLSK